MHPFFAILLFAFSSPSESRFKVVSMSVDEMDAMRPSTWRPGCPVPLGLLRKVIVPYYHPSGESRQGTLIVHQAVATEVGEIFVELHRQQFPIEDISPALTKLGKDDALMRSNITSAFNCRAITGGKGFSRHSYGRAIDINPLWNPYIKGKKVLPNEAPKFARPPRDVSRAGLIHTDSSVVKLFQRYGWKWGGHWKRVKDYQHFEKKRQ